MVLVGEQVALEVLVGKWEVLEVLVGELELLFGEKEVLIVKTGKGAG